MNKIKKGILKLGLGLLTLAFSGAISLGGMLLYIKKTDICLLDDQVIAQNPYYEPGYFNENPVKIGFSDKFKSEKLEHAFEQLREMDENLTGMTFDVRKDLNEEELSKCDIRFIELKKMREKYTETPLPLMAAGGAEVPVEKPGDFVQKVNSDIGVGKWVYLKHSGSFLVSHEVSHCFGLMHVWDAKANMFPGYCLLNEDLTPEEYEKLNIMYPSK